MANTSTQYVEKWLKLNQEGHFQEAKDFYFESLFAAVIEDFKARTEGRFKKGGVLFSILGYTPEPIILTQRALEPQKHVIFFTKNGEHFDNEIAPYLEKYLTSNYELVEFEDASFDTIYGVMKEQMALHPAREYYVDITGGKSLWWELLPFSPGITTAIYFMSITTIISQNYVDPDQARKISFLYTTQWLIFLM